VIGLKQGLPKEVLVLLGRWKNPDSIRPYLAISPQDLNEILARATLE
jgi:hypothetical protein